MPLITPMKSWIEYSVRIHVRKCVLLYSDIKEVNKWCSMWHLSMLLMQCILGWSQILIYILIFYERPDHLKWQWNTNETGQRIAEFMYDVIFLKFTGNVLLILISHVCFMTDVVHDISQSRFPFIFIIYFRLIT